MSVQIPQECKEIEQLVRELESHEFKVKEVEYDKYTNSCRIYFYQPDFDEFYKYFSTDKLFAEDYLSELRRKFSEIKYDLDKKTFDLRLTRLIDTITKAKFGFTIGDKSINFSIDLYHGFEEVNTYEMTLKISNIDNVRDLGKILLNFFK